MSGTAQPIGLPFQEAIDFFRRKLDLQTPAWDTIQKGQHAVAFTVAGAMQAELLADLRGAVDKALSGGGTLAEFRVEFDAIVKRHGWSHKGSPGWRSRVIFETNLRTAYAAGIWEQAQRTKLDRPYLRYVAVMDNRTRPQHEAWHGTILPIGHEFWATHFPPNGWGCRCTVITVSARELARRGWKVSDPPPSSARMPRQVQRSDGTVEIQELPPGIDPGWDYNVGIAALGQELDRAVMAAAAAAAKKPRGWRNLTEGDWRSAGRPEQLPVREPVVRLGPPVADKSGLQAAIAEAVGGESVALQTPIGHVVHVTAAALADHLPLDRAPFVALLPELIERPEEVWLAFEENEATGKVVLRQRFVSRMATGPDRGYLLVAQVVNARLEAWTFMPVRSLNDIQRNRIGKLVYVREEGRTPPPEGPPDEG